RSREATCRRARAAAPRRGGMPPGQQGRVRGGGASWAATLRVAVGNHNGPYGSGSGGWRHWFRGQALQVLVEVAGPRSIVPTRYTHLASFHSPTPSPARRSLDCREACLLQSLCSLLRIFADEG